MQGIKVSQTLSRLHYDERKRQESVRRSYEYQMFAHHLYEYRRGLRNLVLYTINLPYRDVVEKRLETENVDYYVQQVNETKVNVFFGDRRCVDIVKQMNFNSLVDLTDEQDFILGIMLGYDRLKQYERYLKRKHHPRFSGN